MRDKIKAGFTLIELLVVIGIIVIISSLVIINVTQARMNGRDARRISDLKSIQNALEMYYEKNKEYPVATSGSGYSSAVDADWTALGDDTTGLGKYISPLPKDPMNGKSGLKIVGHKLVSGVITDSTSCSDRLAETSPAVMSYQYLTDTAGDNYKITTPLEVRCEGLDANDGGYHLVGGTYTPRDFRYELWGGKDGNAL